MLETPPARSAPLMSSPTQRTLAYMRGYGYTCGITEHWNPHAMIRQDLFGFIDVLAFKDADIIALQACTTGDINKRCNKILLSYEAEMWVHGPRWLIVIGWKRYKKQMCRKWWRPTIIKLNWNDFNNYRSKGIQPCKSNELPQSLTT